MKNTKYTDPTHSVQTLWMANLAVPTRGGLSGFSNTISMDHIELPRHTGAARKQRRAAVKALGKAEERAPSSLWLKENRRTGSYPMKGSDLMIATV